MSGCVIGCVFTPSEWAHFAIEKYSLVEKWLSGASILDPTMGKGELLVALITSALNKGYTIHSLPFETLFGVEMNKLFFNDAFERLKNLCGEKFTPGNFVCNDVLFYNFRTKFDIIFGNPPWVNFNVLPEDYREKIKPEYMKYALVRKEAGLLLGKSQVNFAALIIFSVMSRMVRKHGELVVFLPQSLIFHSGAHQAFTSGKAGETGFTIESIYDLGGTEAFAGISAKYALLCIKRDKKIEFPVLYHKFHKRQSAWIPHQAAPLSGKGSPWVVSSGMEPLYTLKKIRIFESSKPRQGINTCGANGVYFFDNFKEIGHNVVRLKNKDREIEIEKSVVYPLVDRNNFRSHRMHERKWVVLPYHQNGSVFHANDLKKLPLLNNYLHGVKSLLIHRRGKFLKSQIEKGCFWALLGVGLYNFRPFKIVWEAYGKHEFIPLIFEGNWQVGQALYAYLSFDDIQTCKSVFEQLVRADIGKILNRMQMGGTMSWAQPGIMSNFFEIEKTEY